MQPAPVCFPSILKLACLLAGPVAPTDQPDDDRKGKNDEQAGEQSVHLTPLRASDGRMYLNQRSAYRSG